MKTHVFHILISFVFLISSTPAYSLGDYFTKQIRYDDGNGVEGGVYERVDPINVRGTRRLPDPSGYYWNNRGGGSQAPVTGGEPGTGPGDVAMSTKPKPSKFVNNCSADPYFQDTTSKSGFTTRLQMVKSIMAVKTAPLDTFILVNYADGGSEIWRRNATSAVVEPVAGSMSFGSGNAAPCTA